VIARLRALVVGLLLATVAAGPAAAQRAPKGNRPAKVVIAPLTTLGDLASSKRTQSIARAIGRGVAAVPGMEPLPSKQVNAALRKAKRARLNACDGDVGCLAEAGALVGARYVVASELGGLGDAQVVFMKAVDVANRKELASTTLEVGDEISRDAARAAAYRLLRPGDYVGRLQLAIDVEGATVYVDGKAVKVTKDAPLALSVGTHALRITHPEYRDFVRFVEVGFDENKSLDVGMQAFPIITSEMKQREAEFLYDESGRRIVEVTPWYREWYTVAGAGAVLLAGSILTFALISGGVDADREETIGN